MQGKRFNAQRKPLHPASHVKKPYTSKNPLPVRTGDAVAYRGGLLAQMPDVLVVLGNRAVTAEQAGLGNVDDALLAPAQRVAGVVAQGLTLAHHIGVEVGQRLEPVLPDQLVVQAAQGFQDGL